MDQDEVQGLLDRIGVLRHACDLDLLVFFARHPRALLSSESLATFLGYGITAIAESLDVLLAAGLLERRQRSSGVARLYVFAVRGPGDSWIPALLKVASTRDGRLTLHRMLREGPRTDTTPRSGSRPGNGAAPGALRLVQDTSLDDDQQDATGRKPGSARAASNVLE